MYRNFDLCCRDLQSKLQSDAAVEWKMQKRQQNRSVYAHKLIKIETEIEQGLTSHQTHYRSYRGRFLQVIRPNQQCQSTEGV